MMRKEEKKERDFWLYEDAHERYIRSIKETPFFKRDIEDHIDFITDRVDRTMDAIEDKIEDVGEKMEDIEYGLEKINEFLDVFLY